MKRSVLKSFAGERDWVAYSPRLPIHLRCGGSCRLSGPRMSVSLPAGEINERLPGERRVEAEAGIQGAPVSRAKAVRAQEIQIEVEPATPHPPHPFSLRRSSPSPCLLPLTDRSIDWIIVLRLICRAPREVSSVASNRSQLAIAGQ